MENRHLREKLDFFALIKFFLSKNTDYWQRHPDEFYSIRHDIEEIHNKLCRKKIQQNF